MASPEPRAAPYRRAVPGLTLAASGSDAGALPLDALSEVLLRLPAKLLCRLRAVCRAWRSLLSDPCFAAAHAARELHIVASYVGDAERGSLVHILDMSGRIVKQLHGKEGDRVVSMAFDLVCVKAIESGRVRLLNPASGAVYHLSGNLAEEHVASGFSLGDYGEPVYLSGQVASTREYKVLRMLPYQADGDCGDLFEVCTLSSGSHVPWRGKKGPPESFVWNEWTRVVIGGVLYFLSVAAYLAVMNRQVIEQGWIVQFDLEAEEWRPNIRGPRSLVDDGMLNSYHGPNQKQLTLANLNGSLVIVHGPTPYMDLWFLMDSKKGLWVKKYSVQVERSGHMLPMHPLFVLDDGRIVTLIRCMRLLQIHDPRTNTFTRLMILRHSCGISVYRGSLLSLDGEK